MEKFSVDGRTIDRLPIEWYETSKRIIRKRTGGGREVALRFLQESPALTEGDVLYADDQVVIVVDIVPCEVLVIGITGMHAVAAVCYETGNRHLPLYLEDEELLVPFDAPIHRWLVAGGYAVRRETRKLLQPLQSTVVAHRHRYD